MKDINKLDLNNIQKNLQGLEDNKNIIISSKENSDAQNTITPNILSSSRKRITKVVKKRKTHNNLTTRSSTISQLKKEQNQNEIAHNNNNKNENKLSLDENKDIISINDVNNYPTENINDDYIPTEKDLKNVYINNWLLCCFWCTSKKKNVNKVLFEEGSKIITERLDILNMFNHLYIAEIIQKKVGIEAKGINMSENCINNIQE